MLPLFKSIIFITFLFFINGYMHIVPTKYRYFVKRTLTNNHNSLDGINSVPKSTDQRNIEDLLKFNQFAMKSIVAANILLPLSKANAIVESEYNTNSPIVVLGSGGKTGRYIVELLAQKNYPVTPVLRDNKKNIFEKLNDKVNKPLQADVTKIETLANVIQGASTVIFAASASQKGGDAKSVDYLGVENVAKECIRLNIPRLVVISSGAVTKPNSLGYKITNLFGGIIGYKLQGENALRSLYAANNNDLSYVIIRPGGLLDNSRIPNNNEIELNQGDTISGEINRIDVAACVVAAAISKEIPKHVTFEVYESNKSGPLQSEFPLKSGFERNGKDLGGDYNILFKGLKEDQI